MKKLELKHLAPYLPYGVQFKGKFKGWANYSGDIMHLCAVDLAPDKFEEIKPILRPLSDLTKEIEHNGEKFVPYEELFDNNNNVDGDCYYWQTLTLLAQGGGWCGQLPMWLMTKLFEWHFDVFGLIPEGLAIDINTLKK